MTIERPMIWTAGRTLADPFMLLGAFVTLVLAVFYYPIVTDWVAGALFIGLVALIHWHLTYLTLYVGKASQGAKNFAWVLSAIGVVTAAVSTFWLTLDFITINGFEMIGAFATWAQAILASGTMRQALRGNRFSNRILLFLLAGNPLFVSVTYFWRVHDKFGYPKGAQAELEPA